MGDLAPYTLTSKAGKFTFKRGTILSHAKLIRDTVTAAALGTIPNVPRITEDTAVHWIREHLAGPANQTDFVWVAS